MAERFVSSLSEKYKRKAAEELGETDQNREEKIEELRVRIFDENL